MSSCESADDGRHDFDFIFGDWNVHNRKLRDIADPDCTDWVEFDTTSHVEPMFAGLAHTELITCPPEAAGGPWQGFTLRQFEPGQRVWRIWWASSKTPGTLEQPLSGRFDDGAGVFTADEMFAGQPVKVRFQWTTRSTASARWTQAFSRDDGHTWRLNWSMDFTRDIH